MKKTVLVLGYDGYIGHALTLRLLEKGYKVVGLDNFQRRKAVNSVGSFSATEVLTDFQSRYLKISALYPEDFFCYNVDTSKEYDQLKDLADRFSFDIIVNLAQQPSAPFSMISRDHAIRSTEININTTINVLFFMKECFPNAHLVQIGTMGEYAPDVNVDIPEGVFNFEYNGRMSKESIFPRRPGSFYHASKTASTYYIDFACRSWGLNATDIMQGVVYGNWTPEIEKTGLHTRFDSDECFGTVCNRFIMQSVLNVPLTIFGKGLHSRGFLALNDSIQCLMLAIENPSKGYRTWNQLDTNLSMNQVADEVIEAAKSFNLEVQKSYIESPRVECLEDHYYNPIVNKLSELGFNPTRTMKDEVKYAFSQFLPVKIRLEELLSVVTPKILWR